ncbi:hypothetical protein [Microbacterium marinilacus]|uniref:CHAD domain-containing protein n=1 Tax=Microbacterium marinilacus TaxID=415209 RepID=A0ABP7BAD7_9MICO|nr:hypothetical protein [Microbacterium marinilacus]MBY0687003.1 hypothetical protein [Microbacterium marinilacus]
MQTPNATDDVREWRRYAGNLRQTLKHANARALTADRERARGDRLEVKVASLVERLRRNARLLDHLEGDLDAGDIPTAADRLARRRTAIDRAERSKR